MSDASLASVKANPATMPGDSSGITLLQTLAQHVLAFDKRQLTKGAIAQARACIECGRSHGGAEKERRPGGLGRKDASSIVRYEKKRQASQAFAEAVPSGKSTGGGDAAKGRLSHGA